MTTEDQLKEAIKEILYRTETAGNGGYISQFGPVLFSKMAKLIDYDMTKRKINEEP